MGGYSSHLKRTPIYCRGNGANFGFSVFYHPLQECRRPPNAWNPNWEKLIDNDRRGRPNSHATGGHLGSFHETKIIIYCVWPNDPQYTFNS